MFKAQLSVRHMLLGVLLFGCVPGGARMTPCSNDSECPDAKHGRAYCVRRHCVECITRSSCGAHHTCEEGRCVPS